MDYSDLQFHNIQLMKLVSSAEILFQHLYESVSIENKAFISQWLCFKQEYDGDSCDINENVQECPTLTRIDEVSENEKLSSMSSSLSSTSSESSVSSEIIEKKQLDESATRRTNKSMESSTFCSTDNNMLQTDIDLLEYMIEFKLFTDSCVSDWFKTMSFDTSDIKQYMCWLDNKEYKKIWTDIYNNSRRNGEVNNRNYCEQKESNVQIVRDDSDRKFIPINASQLQKKSSTDCTSSVERNSVNYICNERVYHEEYMDEQFRYLYEIRPILVCALEKLKKKFKKDELESSSEFKSYSKMGVAIEIIDLSFEMKHQLKFGHSIDDPAVKDEVDTIIINCLRRLSLPEMRYVFMSYLNNVIEMRECGFQHDKEVMKLESEITNLKTLIWRLSFENRYMNLHKELEEKLQLMGKTTTDESNDESITNVQSRKLLSIVAKNIQGSSQTDSKDVQTAISCIPNIPEKSLKTLQSTASSTVGTKVTRNRRKLIIRTQKQ